MNERGSKKLFQLNVDDIDILLPSMKEVLMLHDENSQVLVLEKISNLIKDNSPAAGETIFSKLITYDVMSTLFEILQTANDPLLPCILEFLSMVSEYRRFYKDHIAMDAVDSMLKITISILKSRPKETGSLEKLISVICSILRRATEFKVDFKSICVPRQILQLLKLLIVANSTDHKLEFPAIALLNIVLEYADLEEECNSDDDNDGDVVFQLFHKALNSMKDIVEYSDDDVAISLAAAELCGICACGTRFGNTDCNENEKSLDRIVQRKTILTKAIYMTVMNTIIPCIKNAELNQMDRIKIQKNLVTCLNNLYKLGSCSADDLSKNLSVNGYLKYFLRLTETLAGSLRRTTCILLSQIITTLAKMSMLIDQSPTGPGEFSNLIYRGLLALPRDCQEWTDTIARQGDSATALTILIYYHFQGTGESDMISLKSLIARIIRLPESERVPFQILKPLWFLFAVASISHSAPNLEMGYGRALKRLVTVLQHSDLYDCYTHHIDLLHHCLKFGEIPKSLRIDVLNLWLIEADGDIEPLLQLDSDKVVKHCLSVVTQIRYPEEIVNLAMKGIRQAVNTVNVNEIGEIVWHKLPSFLSSCDPRNDEQVKAILELANLAKPSSLPLSVINRSADSLVNIVLRKETDVKLKTLVVMQAYVLLVASETRKAFRVLEDYISTPNFLKELHVHAVSEDNLELAAVCLKLLAFIIHCQGKSSIRRNNVTLTIEIQELADLLMNTTKSPHASINAMHLTFELLTQSIDGSAVRLKKIASNTDEVGAVINLYETLYIIYGTSFKTERDVVYQCLSAVIKFCRRNVETLMYHICTLMSNYDLVTLTFNTRHISTHSLEFVSTWLYYRKQYCDDEESWNPRSLRKTPFEENLDQISNYIHTANDAKMDTAHYYLRYVMNRYRASDIE